MKILQEISIPQESVNDQRVTILELYFVHGDKVSKGDILAELETSKTTMTVEAEIDGFIQFFYKVGDDVEVNAILARITDEKPEVNENIIVQSVEHTRSSQQKEHHEIQETIFSIAAQELILEQGLSKDIFQGKDFVGKSDVEKLMGRTKKSSQKPQLINSAFQPHVDDLSKVRTENIGSFKSKEIESLSSVQGNSLVSTVHAYVELEGVFDFVNAHSKYLRNSLLSLVIFEVGRLLRKFPIFNAYYNVDHISFYNNVNVGFAIDIDKGLKVLKIAEADIKQLPDIETEILKLSNEYLDGKIKSDSLMDITFTVTDLSSEGVSFFTPLVNMKNSAILGISAEDKKLKRCTLSLTFDHRVTEGKQAAIFLSELGERISSYQFTAANNQTQGISEWAKTISCYRCFKLLADDISDVGFVKCIKADGMEGYICQACFKGF